jgi:protein ImuB
MRGRRKLFQLEADCVFPKTKSIHPCSPVFIRGPKFLLNFMRLACVFVDRFPFAALSRAEPDLCGAAVAVTVGEGPRGEVVACSLEAEKYGVAPGHRVAQVRVICNSLVLRAASVEAEHAAQEALCDVAYALSPRVEDAGNGMVFLDLDGLQVLHGEEEVVRLLVGGAAAVGLDAAVGIASTKVAARLAACDGGGRAIVRQHDEWSFLAPLPVRTLEPGPALRETLSRWGIRTLGELASLPASSVATRLGPEGAALVRRARGEDESPLVCRAPPLHFEERCELDFGIEAIDPFLFVARPLLDRLTARLALRGLVCGDLRLSLCLANRGREQRTVVVAAPSNEARSLLTLLRLSLEAQPPAAPVEEIHLAAVAEQLRPVQLDLLRPNGPAPARLAITLAKLTALCGDDRVGTPIVADSHDPGAYGCAPFAPGSSEAANSTSHIPDPKFRSNPQVSESLGSGTWDMEFKATRPCGRVALRAVRPARMLEVFEDAGRLDFVRLSGSHEHDVTYRCQGRVVTAAGPWRVQGEWWRESSFHRDYYDVQLSDGAVYRIYFEHQQNQWFVDGVYD